MKIPCHLIKACLNYSLFHVVLLFSLAVANETWTWNGIIGVINARWQSWHKQKPFVFIQPGGVWERLHYTVAWINLGPCLLLSPWEPDTMHYRALRILNTYLNPWCRLLIDLHVRWRTEHTWQCKPDVEYTGGKSWVPLYCIVFFMVLQFDFYYILSQKRGQIRRDHRFTHLYSASRADFRNSMGSSVSTYACPNQYLLIICRINDGNNN